MVKKNELKNGNVVQAKFRKYGVHRIVGVVNEITTDGHGLKGTWVGMKVIGGDLQDTSVKNMVEHKIGVLIPILDVEKVLQETA